MDNPRRTLVKKIKQVIAAANDTSWDMALAA